jgi:hypothetical protein
MGLKGLKAKATKRGTDPFDDQVIQSEGYFVTASRNVSL